MLEQMATTNQPLPRPEDDGIGILEAAKMCYVDYDTFLRWVRKGVIPHILVGEPGTARRSIRVSRRDVQRLIEPRK